MINNMFNLNENHYFYVSNYETAPYLIADLICKNNEGELFKNIFNGFQLSSASGNPSYTISENSDNIKLLIKNPFVSVSSDNL